ncbi:ATP-dependent helicase NAM7 [Spathaspora passalidarum NRRL Y-27907]|uniref:ATP-dependent helicase NAM7 n=1 Tax=Spathaspora passalidarum (strain NRRL Y-27907 / 11-Y1) TaxID=619300 RepID=G3ANF7_SPAPN|nr:ATP-dependent helicase NAM7 [Spathaspora passalidarum NRRL Y-27907]EGW31946.1 ATP-dependent helicase NAM7 [Spathaspora passalidarum NRRL Y-27907]
MSNLLFHNFSKEEDEDNFSNVSDNGVVSSESDNETIDQDHIQNGNGINDGEQHSDHESLVADQMFDSDAMNQQLALVEDLDHAHDEEHEHACSYCGIHTPSSVVKCNTCNKWFCNAKTDSSSSHIITHLVMSRHNQVSLHEDSDLGDTTLECYNCGNKNVFMLGFVSAKQESVVVILCRLPCANSKDINWDTSHWQALIEERQFLSWLAPPPPEEALVNAKLITPQQISKLEAQWRLNRDATINDIENTDKQQEEEVLPILMRYNDAFQYQRSFGPLVKLEADYDKNIKESQALEHIQVKWALGLNNRHLASFTLSTYENSDLKVAVGDEIILRYSGFQREPWEGNGYILRLPNKNQEEFTLELNPSKVTPPTDLTTDFTAEFVWKGTSYDRMQQAMKDFATDETSVSSYIYHKLLGHEVVPIEFDTELPQRFSHPALTELNVSQTNAVRTVLQRPLSLIQGPPGTGKTVTSATIIYHLSKLNKEKILVCAPSNVAVDHLAEKLDLLGLKVVRLTAKSREDVDSSVSHLALHNLVNKGAKGEFKKLIKLKNEVGELSVEDSRIYFRNLRNSESKLLDKCDIVCCTCVGAADKRLSQFKFRTVLIDESTQASEPEVLIPIVKGAKQVILVGDHQQLGPVILDRKAADAGLKQSLFERLVFLGHVPIRLEVQYRMHPCLSDFPSNMFYEGSLQNGVTSDDRLIEDATFPWPMVDTPMMFWANYGREELSSSGNSFLNRVEAMNVEKIITRLFKDGVTPDQIGVITPYEGQRAYLVQFMSMNSTLLDKRDQYLDVEITSVDAFQGREKDFIILSCVRANDAQSIGFLSDPRRLNVALTRAKYGLIVLGNPRALCRNRLWNCLLVHFREKGCLVDGPLDNLQLSMVQLNNTVTSANKYSHRPGKQVPKFGTASTLQSMTDFDSASVLSYDNSAINEGSRTRVDAWPTLGNNNASFNKNSSISANFYSKLDKLNGNYDKTGRYNADNIEDDIRSITSSFAAGLNF